MHLFDAEAGTPPFLKKNVEGFELKASRTISLLEITPRVAAGLFALY